MTQKKFPFIKALMGLSLLGLIYYFAWPFVNGKERMQAFCTATPKGQNISELTIRAQAMSYRVSRSKAEQAIVHDPRTFGRNICYIVLNQDQVVSTKYGFSD